MSWYDTFLTTAYPLTPDKPVPTTVFLGADLYVPESYGVVRIRSLYNTPAVFSCVISDGAVDLAVLTLQSPVEGIYDVTPIVASVYGSLVLGPGVGRDVVITDEPLFFEEHVVTRYARAVQDSSVNALGHVGTLKLVLPDTVRYTLSTEQHDLGNGMTETSVIRLDVTDQDLLVRAVPPGYRDGNATPATECVRQINSVPPSTAGSITLTFLQRLRWQDQPDVAVSTSLGVITLNDAGDVCS